ncbi:hypothetical protein B0H63DRAFT_301283 [Podospora didyma]|uniref:RBR-type E3 ubiquitin transferase n=1 Tax=Podospora didyma TaxID=330526 RepID=A0AAE0N7S2_9PEZI|nr:hypothetical protein B0H63DRAFT_301283 [Podospora didyma]
MMQTAARRLQQQPRVPRRSLPAGMVIAPGNVPHPELRVECIICTTSFPQWKALEGIEIHQLPCRHFHCDACFRTNCKISLRTMPFRPVRCCGPPVPTSELRRHLVFTQDELTLYREKLTEFNLRDDLLYCWDPKCSAFIPPALRTSVPREAMAMATRTTGGTSALCRKCKTKTCMACRAKFHFGPCNPASVVAAARRSSAPAQLLSLSVIEQRFKALSKRMGWKPCPACKRMVEKMEGCNHIICTCGCHFCYRCGKAPYDNHGPCGM